MTDYWHKSDTNHAQKTIEFLLLALNPARLRRYSVPVVPKTPFIKLAIQTPPVNDNKYNELLGDHEGENI